jgi:hypothetical protein
MLVASAADVGLVIALAGSGMLMTPLPAWIIGGLLGATLCLALIMDLAKVVLLGRLRIDRAA